MLFENPIEKTTLDVSPLRSSKSSFSINGVKGRFFSNENRHAYYLNA